MVAGAHGLVEINSRLRSDQALLAAFRRGPLRRAIVGAKDVGCLHSRKCAADEVIVDPIYRQHSQGSRHDYESIWRALDVDMSGVLCGPKGAFATRGYFAKQCNRRGRQLGRVLTGRYDEVVVDRLFVGTMQLAALPALIEVAEHDCACRFGGFRLFDIDWLLARGYQMHGKDFSSHHAGQLAKSAAVWFDDPDIAGQIRQYLNALFSTSIIIAFLGYIQPFCSCVISPDNFDGFFIRKKVTGFR
jgi:hypothetical protein